MPAINTLAAIRSAARSFEEGLPAEQRKRTGQFFTGLPLGALLAHLALDNSYRTVIDPMAGHGDLLDAAATAARARGLALDRLDGIEVDPATAAFCRDRSAALRAAGGVNESCILLGNAFDPTRIDALEIDGYDLVITNPPYVRYQSQNGEGTGIDNVRRGLSRIVEERFSGEERTLWKALVEGYSGLADLSIPAWLLSALLTRPGGRLALVIPATWRSRDYADVVRYLLLRLFSLEFIVADTQPGWFSDALVRTHLVVARRLDWDTAATTLSRRTSWPSSYWLKIEPMAASDTSLTGGAFPGPTPEADFAAWAALRPRPVKGIESRPFALQDEWQMLEQRLKRKNWFQKAEDSHDTLALFSRGRTTTAAMPEELREMLPADAVPTDLQTLDEAGIRVSQGLRTGCNRFFYVTLVGTDTGESVTVEASDTFHKMRLRVPSEALRLVLHRQADIPAFIHGHMPATRALDLSSWILPEDEPVASRATEAYRKRGMTFPRIMPEELANFVRLAAYHAPDPKAPARLIPDLSAVRTNIRQPANGHDFPRFWYMLPAFTARHRPAIFTPRINHGNPTVVINATPPILIDANFSTVWSESKWWTSHALYAFFNSSWCRAGMEATGTPLGGGALKLEATHIRQLLIPLMAATACQRLDRLGQQLMVSGPVVQQELNMFMLAAAFPSFDESSLTRVASHIDAHLQAACAARQRIAS